MRRIKAGLLVILASACGTQESIVDMQPGSSYDLRLVVTKKPASLPGSEPRRQFDTVTTLRLAVDSVHADTTHGHYQGSLWTIGVPDRVGAHPLPKDFISVTRHDTTYLVLEPWVLDGSVELVGTFDNGGVVGRWLLPQTPLYIAGRFLLKRH